MNNGVRKIHSPIDFTSNSESKESVNCFQPIVDTKLLAWPPLPEILAVSVISIAIAFSSTSASQPLHSTSTPCYALRLKGKPVLHTAEIHAQRSLSSHTPRKSMIGSGVQFTITQTLHVCLIYATPLGWLTGGLAGAAVLWQSHVSCWVNSVHHHLCVDFMDHQGHVAHSTREHASS